MYNLNDCCDLCRPCDCCHNHKDEHSRFLSSYIEAVGNSQTVATDGNFVFDTIPDAIDIAGDDIELDATGTIFTIKRSGLYHVEWSMNLASDSEPILVGLWEGGAPSSALSNANLTGNYSSGALINVRKFDVPLTLSLRNFGAPITIENPVTAVNTAVSIRILRFADGAKFGYHTNP